MRVRLAALLTLAVLGSALSGAQAGNPPTVAVRVEAGGLSDAGVDALWSASYGAFEWAEVRRGDLGAMRSAAVSFETHPQAGRLVLPGGTFDPAAVSLPALKPGRAQLHVIQLRGPSKDAWLDALRARRARLVQFVAPFSYVALLDPADAGAVSGLRFVRAVVPFTSELRFGKLQTGPGGKVGVVVLDDGDVRGSVRAIEKLTSRLEVTTTLPFMDVDATGLSLTVSATALPKIAALPNVYSISPVFRAGLRDEMSDQIVAGNYNATGVPQTGFQPWLAGKGVTGAGVVVAHVDSGADLTHPDLLRSGKGCKDYVAAGALCTVTGVPNSNDLIHVNSDTLGHGTHTAGIIAGRGFVPATDAGGFTYGLGVAPGAKLYVQNYVSLAAPFGPSGAGQYLQLNKDSVLGGATISANSWGPAGSPRGYDADTREFDHAPRDANLDTPQHESLAFVLSIMNGNGSGPGGAPTQGTPDEGKNLLRVGSTKNYRAGNISDLASSTAHGPALDGRRLPDVVAPGENVISTKSSIAVPIICGTPVADVEGALYASCTGTSMASPHVSGASALFTEWWRKGHGGQSPSPALQKAAFVNGAVDLAGARDADNGIMGHIPDSKQGWGRINLENAFGGTEKAYLDQTVVLGETGQAHSLSVEPVDPSKPVKITLVWTDTPGPGLGGNTPAWVNDLDLRVMDGEGESAVTYLGNAFGSPSTGWSVSGGVADFRNNIENVYLQQAPAGPLTVEVVAANLAGDGVPGNGDDTDQDFVLVISNGRIA